MTFCANDLYWKLRVQIFGCLLFIISCAAIFRLFVQRRIAKFKRRISENSSQSVHLSTAKKFFVLGHRGGSYQAAENSRASFEWALSHNFSGIELDVRMTKDGKVFVLHDPTLRRTHNNSPTKIPLSKHLKSCLDRPVSDLSWDVVKKIPIGHYAGEEQFPMLLSEALEFVKVFRNTENSSNAVTERVSCWMLFYQLYA